VQNDIAKEKVDAIVNAAKNKELNHGWGIAGSIA